MLNDVNDIELHISLFPAKFTCVLLFCLSTLNFDKLPALATHFEEVLKANANLPNPLRLLLKSSGKDSRKVAREKTHFIVDLTEVTKQF